MMSNRQMMEKLKPLLSFFFYSFELTMKELFTAREKEFQQICQQN